MRFHDELAAHARLVDGAYPPTASTHDYLVASTAACMTGVLSGALIAWKIPTDDGRLRANAVGDVVDDDGILVLRRLHLIAHLVSDACPIYRSTSAAIEITSGLDVRPLAAS